MARTSRSSAPNLSIIDELEVFLTKRYKLPDLGEVEWYLGLELNRADGERLFSPKKSIRDLLQKHRMQESMSASTPITEVR